MGRESSFEYKLIIVFEPENKTTFINGVLLSSSSTGKWLFIDSWCVLCHRCSFARTKEYCETCRYFEVSSRFCCAQIIKGILQSWMKWNKWIRNCLLSNESFAPVSGWSFSWNFNSLRIGLIWMSCQWSYAIAMWSNSKRNNLIRICGVQKKESWNSNNVRSSVTIAMVKLKNDQKLKYMNGFLFIDANTKHFILRE